MANGMPPSPTKTTGAAGIRNNGKTEVCRGQKKCSVSAAHEVAWAYWNNLLSLQTSRSAAVTMLQTGPILQTIACWRLYWGEHRTSECRIALMNRTSRSNWSSESQASVLISSESQKWRQEQHRKVTKTLLLNNDRGSKEFKLLIHCCLCTYIIFGYDWLLGGDWMWAYCVKSLRRFLNWTWQDSVQVYILEAFEQTVRVSAGTENSCTTAALPTLTLQQLESIQLKKISVQSLKNNLNEHYFHLVKH